MAPTGSAFWFRRRKTYFLSVLNWVAETDEFCPTSGSGEIQSAVKVSRGRCVEVSCIRGGFWSPPVDLLKMGTCDMINCAGQARLQGSTWSTRSGRSERFSVPSHDPLRQQTRCAAISCEGKANLPGWGGLDKVRKVRSEGFCPTPGSAQDSFVISFL